MPIDRGIWATWYDLPAEGGDDYLAWLHEVHLPEAIRRPGYLWAAHFEVAGGGSRMSQVKEKLTYTSESGVGGGNGSSCFSGPPRRMFSAIPVWSG